MVISNQFLEEYKISYTNALLLGIKEASQNSIEYNEDIKKFHCYVKHWVFK